MKWIDIVLILFLAVIIGAAVAYVIRAKKNGVKCIGCPANGSCSRNNDPFSGCSCGSNGQQDGSCSCGCHADTEE